MAEKSAQEWNETLRYGGSANFTMTKMLTLFGEDVGKLGYNDLKRERAMQAYLLRLMKKQIAKEHHFKENRAYETQRGDDKISFCGIYIAHLEAFIRELDYWLNRKFEPEENYKVGTKRKWQIREANQLKRKENIAENARLYKWEKSAERDGFLVSWDKEKFMSIAADRGYQTEEALVQDVGKELNLDRARAIRVLENGRFTWGQVLCLGAMLQTTPKEFCDTFLNGYFVDRYGEFRADYDNISREELLRSPVRPMPMAEPEIIEVDEYGKPIDEEEWFD